MDNTNARIIKWISKYNEVTKEDFKTLEHNYSTDHQQSLVSVNVALDS